MEFSPICQKNKVRKYSVLIVATIPPFPARENGLSIRYAPIIKRLTATHNVDVGLILDSPIDISSAVWQQSGVRDVTQMVREKIRPSVLRRIRARLASALGTTVPSTVFRYDKERILSFLFEAAQADYDLVIVTDSLLSGLVRKAFPTARMVVDAIDSRYLLFTRSASRSMLARLEGKRMLAWERGIERYADAVTYISEFDRASIYGLGSKSDKVSVIPNGVFEDDFENGESHRLPETVVYLGHMSYRPNIRASVRAARVLQLVQEVLPSAQLKIVGRNPSEEVLQLGGIPGVDVTGTVPSVWPYLQSASVCLFPMIEGAGQQNKLLEAMRAGTPVVTTSVGNLGVGAKPGSEVIIGESDEQMAAEVVKLLKEPDYARQIGEMGRAFVQRTYSWDRSWQMIEDHWLGMNSGGAQ